MANNTNSPSTTLEDEPPSERFLISSTPGVGSILVYSDDANFISLEDRPPIVALKNLGYSYTAVGDGNFAAFGSLLVAGGPWDLFIYNEEDSLPGSASQFNALANYLASGGRAIVTTWNLHHYPTNPLWAELGLEYNYTLQFSGSKNMYLWDLMHPIFTTPNGYTKPINIQRGIVWY